MPDPSTFLWIAGSIAYAAAVNPNGIETLLANGLSTFLIKGNLVFINGLKDLPKNSPDCSILSNRVFNNFILVDEPFAKTLPSFQTCVLVNENFWEKLFSWLESPTTFEEIFSATSVPFFISHFNQ